MFVPPSTLYFKEDLGKRESEFDERTTTCIDEKRLGRQKEAPRDMKKGLYLQTYEGYYVPGRGKRNRSFKALGYFDEFKGNGIEDSFA